MTIVDTSIWIDHFRYSNNLLKALLLDGEVLMHPFVIGELSLGSFKNRTEIMRLLSQLPQATLAEHAEALALVERNHLIGTGLGWIDVHLIAAALISKSTLLTFDKALLRVAETLGLSVPNK